MRMIILAVLLAAGFGIVGAPGAGAAPVQGTAIAAAADDASGVTQVRGLCGRGWHRGPRGRCVRNRRP